MKFFKIVGEITVDTFYAILYFIENNLLRFSNLLIFILPYIMLWIGQHVMFERGMFAVGGEIFVPLVFTIIVYYLKSFANKLGKGTTIPLPNKRFTEVDDDGEVSVEHKRLQEMLLYVADLEDWLERKGLM